MLSRRNLMKAALGLVMLPVVSQLSGICQASASQVPGLRPRIPNTNTNTNTACVGQTPVIEEVRWH